MKFLKTEIQRFLYKNTPSQLQHSARRDMAARTKKMKQK
jgi:hypothetical protein